MKQVDSTTAAYFAGHFDGEGCVDINVSSNQMWNHARLQVTVGSCNLPILLKYREVFGGAIYNHHKPVKNWRQAGKWMVQSKTDIARFLLTIEPYCVEKKAQVSLCLNFITDHIEKRPKRWEIEMIHAELSKMKRVEHPFNQFKGVRNESISED